MGGADVDPVRSVFGLLSLTSDDQEARKRPAEFVLQCCNRLGAGEAPSFTIHSFGPRFGAQCARSRQTFAHATVVDLAARDSDQRGALARLGKVGATRSFRYRHVCAFFMNFKDL